MRISTLLSIALACIGVQAAPVEVEVNSACSEPAVYLTNQSDKWTEYHFFRNLKNGDGCADPDYVNSEIAVGLNPGESWMIPLDYEFKGRIQRGKAIPAT